MQRLRDIFFSASVENEFAMIPIISTKKCISINATLSNIPEHTPAKIVAYFYEHQLDQTAPMILPHRCKEHSSPFHPENLNKEDHLQFLSLENCKGSFIYSQRQTGLSAMKYIEIFVSPPKGNEPAVFRLIFKVNCDLQCDFGSIKPLNHFVLQLDLELKNMVWKTEKILLQLGPRPDSRKLKSPENSRKTKMTLVGSPIKQKQGEQTSPYKYLAVKGRKNYEILKKINEGLEAREKLASLGTLPCTNPSSPIPVFSTAFPFNQQFPACLPKPQILPTVLHNMQDNSERSGSVGPIPFYNDPGEDSQGDLIQPLNLADREDQEGPGAIPKRK